ncbi:uncharacterized protein LOC135810903 [Sycon ciliatum]
MYFVCESSLFMLMKYCPKCGGKVICRTKTLVGPMLVVKMICEQDCDVIWRSHTTTGKAQQQSLCSILLVAAILLCGGTYSKFSKFAEFFHLQFMSRRTFFSIQQKFVFPVIQAAWLAERTRVHSLLLGRQLTLAGDGRCDSPGYSARFGTYTFMDVASDLIVDYHLAMSTDTTSSVAMEKMGFVVTLDRCLEQGLKIATVVTDRSPSIKKEMRGRHSIKHQFDVWHYAKSVASKIRAGCRRKDQQALLEWLPAINNHLWYCARSCGGNAVLLREKWNSVLYHIVNRHSWTEGTLFTQCAHPPLSTDEQRQKKWLTPGSPAYKVLESVVQDKRLLADLMHLSDFQHTGNLEVYHSMMTKYMPKRIQFSREGMEARTQLAALDHNFNAGREQATSKGQPQYKVQFSRVKGDFVAKKIYSEKKYGCMHSMMQQVSDVATKRLTVPPIQKCKPVNVSRRGAPVKAAVVANLQTRLAMAATAEASPSVAPEEEEEQEYEVTLEDDAGYVQEEDQDSEDEGQQQCVVQCDVPTQI